MKFIDDEKIAAEVHLPEVVVVGVNLKMKNAYLAVSGRSYHDNPKLFREAIRFMQRIGDIEGERRIFMKSFNAGRERSFQKVVLPMMGVMALPFIVEVSLILASSPTIYSTATKLAPYFTKGFGFYKKSTYARMAFNTVLQMKLSDDGFRDVNLVSIAAETLPFGLNMLTNVVEWTPFKEEEDERFRLIFRNKNVSEVIFDMSTQYAAGYISEGISETTGRVFKSAMTDRTVKNGVNYFVKPQFSLLYEIINLKLTEKAKEQFFEDEKKETK
jgi:hypothetical protein